MTWIITATATGLGISQTAAAVVVSTAASAGVAAYGQHQQGKITEAIYEKEANEAELEASFTELQRREKLNRALAMNLVGQAGSGIKGDGTPESIALESAKNVGTSEQAESLSERLKQAQLRRTGKAAASAGKTAAASTLLTGAIKSGAAYHKGKI